MFQDTILPEETILAGVGIQAGRNSGSPENQLWYHFDLFNPGLHEGKVVRLWGRFPDLSKNEESIEWDEMLQGSGFVEMFLTSTPEKIDSILWNISRKDDVTENPLELHSV